MKNKTIIATDSPVWARIEEKQAELAALYAEAAEGIVQSTECAAWLGEKNQAFVDFWVRAVKFSPKAVAGEFDLPDFELKAALFPKFVQVYNSHNAAGAILVTPYDAVSKDIFRYSFDAKNAFSMSNNAICKQALKDAPKYRKPAESKTTTTGTETPADKPIAVAAAH